jgi:hypothetical protein
MMLANLSSLNLFHEHLGSGVGAAFFCQPFFTLHRFCHFA